MNPSHRLRLTLAFAAALSLLASCDSGGNSSNSDPISSGNSDSTIPWNSSISYGSLTYAGQTYKTVKIGTQTWMAENLNYKVDSSWCYANSADSCAKYGRLYQWAAVMGLDASYNSIPWSGTLPHQGICPSGWHVPSNGEWTTLAEYEFVWTTDEDYFNGDSIGMKLKSECGWSGSRTGTDVYGFRALPAGYRDYYGSFNQVGRYAVFWNSTEYWNKDFAYSRGLDSGYVDLLSSEEIKDGGSSLRCIKDAP